MPYPPEALNKWFAEPVNDRGQDEARAEILEQARKLAETINTLLPDGQGKDEVLQNVRTAVMTSEAVIRWNWHESKLSLVQ